MATVRANNGNVGHAGNEEGEEGEEEEDHQELVALGESTSRPQSKAGSRREGDEDDEEGEGMFVRVMRRKNAVEGALLKHCSSTGCSDGYYVDQEREEKVKREKRKMFDEEVDRYETYEDYLDSLVSEEDHYYLEDERMARIIAELGYR